jgi:superfamily I DNA/RNA helicase
LRFSTIHSFKGLDALAVITTDIDEETMPNFESLLYVGMTRAIDRLAALIEISFDQYLRNRPSILLTGPSPLCPAIQFISS